MPPPAVTLAVPFDPPLQLTGVALQLITNAVGCVTTDVQVAVHPLASVTATVYVPAALPLIVDVAADVLHK